MARLQREMRKWGEFRENREKIRVIRSFRGVRVQCIPIMRKPCAMQWSQLTF